MLLRMLGARAFMSLSCLAGVVLLLLGAYLVVGKPLHRSRSYCAMMPDSIGLYTGSDVTMRGIRVGTVDSVQPEGTAVRVGFTVDADHLLPADVAATTLADTLVADRELAVLGTGTDGGQWDSSRCVTKTLTPKSMTETLDALADLSDQLRGAAGARQHAVGDSLRALNAATAGTGPQVDALIGKFAVALRSPDAAIGHVGAIIDGLSSLSASAAGGWSDIESMLTRFTPMLDFLDDRLFPLSIQLVDGLSRLLPMLNDVTSLFGDELLKGLDATLPLLRFIGANVATLRQMVAMIPVVASGFTRSVDSGTGAMTLSYAPARVRIPESDAAGVCAAVDAVVPGRCTAVGDGVAKVDLAQLVLAIAGAR
ncbi:MlaD family protein [Nocardia nova]|uniref:MlaD family protein n=1 Tax=Nocardia nova TaxID=37330 RepID=UPI0033C471A1